MTKLRQLAVCASCVVIACLAWMQPAQSAEKYPARPIRILIPFPAGGAADVLGREIGQILSAKFGQPVVCDNRPGAAGRLATQMLAQSTPDGYTLLLGTAGAIAVDPSLHKHLNYNVEKDIQPVTFVGQIINVMVVNASTPVKTVQQFIDWAKRRQNVRFGSSGTGQTDHLAGLMFEQLTGLHMTHVPYKGGGPAMIDLLSGDLQVMFPTYTVAVPHIKAGKLRLLGVATPKRQAVLPGVPAVSETVPGFGIVNWDGVFAPARTPKPIVNLLLKEINVALKDPGLVKRVEAAGLVPSGSASPEAFRQFIRENTKDWAKIVHAAHLSLD